MNEKQARGIIEASGALLEGHFILSSGMHSDHYLQCALVLRSPAVGRKIGRAIARLWPDCRIDLVVGPALGGILVAYAVAEALKTDAIFAERENGVMTLRRGFSIAPGARVLVAEDVITTGGSALEVARLVESSGGAVVGLASIADRTGGKKLPYDLRSLMRADFPAYPPDQCPLCSAGSKAVKPGSRNIQ